jgi:hypothetical protein
MPARDATAAAGTQCVEPRIAVTAAQPAVMRRRLPPVLDCGAVVGPEPPAANRVKEPAQPAAGQAITNCSETPVSGTRRAIHTYGIPMAEAKQTDEHVSSGQDPSPSVTWVGWVLMARVGLQQPQARE